MKGNVRETPSHGRTFSDLVKAAIKKLIVLLLPLALRKRLAIWVNRQERFAPGDRAYWATELIRDFAERDVNAYHKFLWEHHLAYAETYEVGLRFGFDRFNETRKMLFAELSTRLDEIGVTAADEIESVLEVGSSLGYLLRYMETDVFRNADRLEGIDIDARAISEGARYLETLGSRIKLHCGDMESLDSLVGDAKYDVVLASGVLLYLDRSAASKLVSEMLARTRKVLVITALAHPSEDNARLEHSTQRESDGTWIHNVDRMVVEAGGRVAARRWEGSRIVDGNTIYFLYALPPQESQ